MRIKRVPNSKVRSCVERRETFTNTNQTIVGSNYTTPDGVPIYVVVSYGPHWPMYVAVRRHHGWDWLQNADPSPSRTTSRHTGLARPFLFDPSNSVIISKVPGDALHCLINLGLSEYTKRQLEGAISHAS